MGRVQARTSRGRKNKVFLDEHGFVHIIYRDAQTKAGLESDLERAVKLAESLVEKDEPVYVLMDIREMDEHTFDMRMTAMRIRTRIPFWKMAIIVGADTKDTESTSRKITAMSGRKKSIGYYDSEDAATKWLLEGVESDATIDT